VFGFAFGSNVKSCRDEMTARHFFLKNEARFFFFSHHNEKATVNYVGENKVVRVVRYDIGKKE
jgi:hypothetical protein